jgi:hypothetical protein
MAQAARAFISISHRLRRPGSNLVERFFGLITEDAIRRGVFHNVADLEAAIKAYLEHHNADPRPFIWTAPALDILKKVARGRQVLQSVH